MLLMGESVYQLSEPTMHEFRLILEFNHFKEVNKDVYNEFSKMKFVTLINPWLLLYIEHLGTSNETDPGMRAHRPFKIDVDFFSVIFTVSHL